MQSIRYDVGLPASSAITTAAFIDAGLITEEDKKLVVDHSKGEIECIFFGSCIDATKVMLKANNSEQQFSSTFKEEHYSMCSERYLYNFTPEKGSKTGKPAQMIADNLVYFMKKKGIDKSLKAIGEDSTNVNTG
ncbi:hypothetical protein E2320_017710 [Naja naja]|nr:hypothetical protein E2320_017710 [Naja naja]